MRPLKTKKDMWNQQYYLRQTGSALCCPQRFVNCEEMDGNIRKENWRELVNNSSPFLTPLSKVYDSRYKGESVAVRDALKKYVNAHK